MNEGIFDFRFAICDLGSWLIGCKPPVSHCNGAWLERRRYLSPTGRPLGRDAATDVNENHGYGH